MGNFRFHRAYSVTTTVETNEDGHGEFAVFDIVRIGSSPEKRIARFKGTEEDCLAYGEQLAQYWMRTFEKAPPLDE